MKFNEAIDSNTIVHYPTLLSISNINFVSHLHNNMSMPWLFTGIVSKNITISKIK